MEVLYQSGLIRERYRIIGVLGEGGTAITYEAIDTFQDNLTVAIKVLSLQKTQDWKLVELFEREVKVLKNLQHPKIPKYLDYFTLDTETDKQFFLVQELISGKSLATLIESGWRFQEEDVKNIAQQILEILIYLHSFQPPVIHRDIKPHNIIRSDEGEVYLVDLGAVQDVYRNTLTRGATFVGTIDYMSPEQLRGHASFASDLYSLGCTLLYLLTRRSPSELPLQRMKINFRSSLHISEQFDDWLDIMIAPALEDRFSSTNEALKKLNSKQSFIVKPLAGSSIQIKKKTNGLFIYVPPTKKLASLVIINFTECSLALVATIFLSQFSFFLLHILIASYNYALLLFTVFIWTIFVLGLAIFATKGFGLLFLVFGQIYLKIEPKQFQIFWSCLGVKYKRAGHTSDIEAIAITKSKSKEFMLLPEEYCVIYEGVKEHKLGRWLSKAERRWLITEIANFVAEQYPHKNKEDWLRDLWKN